MSNNLNFTEDFYENKVISNVRQRGFLGFLYHKLSKFEKHRYDEVADLIANKKNLNFLDIGCYEGDLIKKISNKTSIANIYGVDINRKVIEKCKQSFSSSANNFSVQNIDAGILFENDKFDLVTMVAALEHVFDPIFVIQEVSITMKRGGQFIVEVPNIAFIKYRLSLLFGKRPRTSWDYGWDGGHLQYFDTKDLIKLLEDNNFKIKKVSGSGIFHKTRIWWPSLLFSNIIIKCEKI